MGSVERPYTHNVSVRPAILLDRSLELRMLQISNY